MNTELQQLKDIHLPNPISMWPVTPGWIILLVLVLGFMSYLIYSIYRQYKKKSAIRFALSRLKYLKSSLSENSNNTHIAAELSTLIRRTALHYFQREKIAGLTGNDWLNFLNHTGNTTQFTEEIGYLLVNAPYRKNNTADLRPLIGLIQEWLLAISKNKHVFKGK